MSQPDRPYCLEAADKCGVFRVQHFEQFADLYEAAEMWREELGKGVALVAVNQDQSDEGDNGLTEDEREAWEGL